MSHPGSTKHDNTYEHCGANHVFQYEVFHDVLPIGHPAKLLYRHANPTTESFRTLAYERRNESADPVNGYNRKRMNARSTKVKQEMDGLKIIFYFPYVSTRWGMR
jgi:hypothetical protein